MLRRLKSDSIVQLRTAFAQTKNGDVLVGWDAGRQTSNKMTDVIKGCERWKEVITSLPQLQAVYLVLELLPMSLHDWMNTQNQGNPKRKKNDTITN